MNQAEQTRVAILGAGPVGLEAGHALRELGYDVQIYEQGQVGQALRRWGHVKMFSPWSLNTSALGLEALAEQGLEAPQPDVFPTGAAYVTQYLEPLARHHRLVGRIHTHTRVLGIGRQDVLKGELIASTARREQPFRLLLESQTGQELIQHAQIVLDTTGTYDHPNALGSSGLLAPGERKAAQDGQISHYIPDALGADRAELAGKHIAVVGAGYSAITSLRLLLDLAQQAPGTRITWITRQGQAPYTRIEEDPLPQRDELALLGNQISQGEHEAITHIGEACVEAIEQTPEGLTLHLGQDRRVQGVHRVYANTGYHPDSALYRELQVHQCYASEGPMKLAAALLAASGGGGDCLSQSSMGPDTLKSPEPDFYILGSKSYGRGSSFLLKLGLEQIEDLKTLL